MTSQHQALDSEEKVPGQFLSGGAAWPVLDYWLPTALHLRPRPPNLQHLLLPLYDHTSTSDPTSSSSLQEATAALHVKNHLPPRLFQGFQIFILFTARTSTFRAAVLHLFHLLDRKRNSEKPWSKVNKSTVTSDTQRK